MEQQSPQEEESAGEDGPSADGLSFRSCDGGATTPDGAGAAHCRSSEASSLSTPDYEGILAVAEELLREDIGFRVLREDVGCCGRPLSLSDERPSAPLPRRLPRHSPEAHGHSGPPIGGAFGCPAGEDRDTLLSSTADSSNDAGSWPLRRIPCSLAPDGVQSESRDAINKKIRQEERAVSQSFQMNRISGVELGSAPAPAEHSAPSYLGSAPAPAVEHNFPSTGGENGAKPDDQAQPSGEKTDAKEAPGNIIPDHYSSVVPVEVSYICSCGASQKGSMVYVSMNHAGMIREGGKEGR